MARTPEPQDAPPRVASWFNKMEISLPKQEKRTLCGAILYTWWNIWKERNRRIFQGLERDELHVAMLAKEEIDAYRLANCLTLKRACLSQVLPGFSALTL